MRRYFFDTLNGEQIIDDEGEMLRDDDAAKRVAAQIAAELTPTRAAHLWAGKPLRVVIRDADKAVIGYVLVTARSIDVDDARPIIPIR